MRPNREHVRALIRSRIETAKALGIKPRRRRIPRQARPLSLSVEYFKALKAILEFARARVKDRLLPRLSGWSLEFKRDAASDEVDDVVAEIKKAVDTQWPNARLRELAESAGRRAVGFQKEQWLRQVRAALGVDILATEPNLGPRLQTFAAENAALIKSIPERALGEVEALVLRAVQNGTRQEDIASEIEDRFGVAEDRAALIARDQIQKLVAATDRERQESLGIERFIWRTAGDERVRESHAALEGETFPWSDPPVVDGEVAIPGSPINCRCTAEPVFDDVLGRAE